MFTRIGLTMIGVGALLVAASCEKKSEPAAPANSPPTATAPVSSAGHGGPVIELGEGVFGPYAVRATRDQRAITPGGDAPVDMWIEPASEDAPKVVAVRFWIGVEDASGSIKARASVENPNDPNRWHNHAEVPDPMPQDTKLWIEIEDAAGGITKASFDLLA